MADSKKIIISFRTGRLANRLILFANVIALTEERGWQVSNVNFHSYAGFFKSTRRDIYCRYPAAKKRSWVDFVPGLAPAIRKSRIFSNAARYAGLHHQQIFFLKNSAVLLREQRNYDVMDLDGDEFTNKTRDARIIFIHGWKFRTPKLVERHAQKIRDYFQLLDKFEIAANAVIENLRRDSEIVGGVHIRHGDYRKFMDGRFFFPVSRYADWMREMAAQFPGRKVSFFVCSDEPRNAGEFPELSVEIGAGPPVVDLYTLAKCDYILGPASTFSQWASFYGAKPLLHFYGSGERIEMGRFHVSNLDLIE